MSGAVPVSARFKRQPYKSSTHQKRGNWMRRKRFAKPRNSISRRLTSLTQHLVDELPRCKLVVDLLDGFFDSCSFFGNAVGQLFNVFGGPGQLSFSSAEWATVAMP